MTIIINKKIKLIIRNNSINLGEWGRHLLGLEDMTVVETKKIVQHYILVLIIQY